MADERADLEAVFNAARQLPPAERAAYLDQVCSGDAALRKRVEQLLGAQSEIGSFLESPAPELDATRKAPVVTERLGTVIGPYKLVEQIGEGGFGVVFLAEQQHPVRRTVALKVLKPGMDTRQVIARFEAERQALAVMDHPNIAKVFDAGETASGRPYFVMELVRGVPIADYCNQAQLTPRGRLELFVGVCHAIQHAHQKGIIHRDLKSSNVLVATHDGRPSIKVIDFGIAKATLQPSPDAAQFTAIAQMVGTPLYMSPEQAAQSPDIDTRSDIYSLGVMLYELLTGTTPFDKERFRRAAYDEIRRIIREEEPPKPSSRLSESKETLPSISAQRQTEPAKLTKLVRGELDWIVMKALEKDRNRRYETANGLAMDVQRYLADEPVTACPPSARYRLRKFAQRNRAAVLLVAAVSAALILGMTIAIWQAVRATRAEGNAVAAAEAQKKEKEAAEASEALTRAVLEFVEDKVFAAARPLDQEGGLGHDVTLRKAIEAALPFVNESFTDRPLIEARLRMTLGRSFLFLGEAKFATEQLETARELFTRHLGPDHPETLKCLMRLANCYAEEGRSVDAFKLREETSVLMNAILGAEHPDTLSNTNNLANSYVAFGRHDEALILREKTLAVRQARFGPRHPDTLSSMNNLALSRAHFGRHTEALKLHEETLALRQEILGPRHPDTLKSMSRVADCFANLGRHDDALKLNQETLALRQARLGVDHPDTLWSMFSLAHNNFVLGRHADALKLDEESLARRKATLGPNHVDTLLSTINLARDFAALGRQPEAIDTLQKAIEVVRVAQLSTAERTRMLASIYKDLALVHAQKGEWDQAAMASGKAIESGADATDLVTNGWQLAWLRLYLSDEAENRRNCLRLLERYERTTDPWQALQAARICVIRPDRVVEPLRAVQLAKRGAELKPDSAHFWDTLGLTYYRAGDWKAAYAAHAKAMPLRSNGSVEEWRFVEAMVHWQLGDKERARKSYDEGVRWLEENKKGLGHLTERELHSFREEAAALLGIKGQLRPEAKAD